MDDSDNFSTAMTGQGQDQTLHAFLIACFLYPDNILYKTRRPCIIHMFLEHVTKPKYPEYQYMSLKQTVSARIHEVKVNYM